MNETKLHLGCGAIIIPGWTNYDVSPGPGGIVRDLTRPFPEFSDSVDFIFHEHFFEHMTRAVGLSFLRECWRVLKSGGVLRIVTPDLHQLCRDYLEGKIDRFKGAWEPKTRCAMVNEGMRFWGHEFLYDGEELNDALRDAGFVSGNIRILPYRHSAHQALKGIDQRPNHGELIFEATK
jgi:predicted SAM-dependent methyltransferase